MPSPFPGMNPFLEQEDAWNDFHERFIPAAAEEIGQQVAPAYIVKIDQNVYVHELPDEGRGLLGRLDAYVAEGDPSASALTGSVTLEAPSRARLAPLTISEREAFIEIRARAERKLITAVELLSPTNKASGSDRDQYLAKRDRYLKSGVHLVEIDLLRGGHRATLDPPQECDYCIVVSRAEERPDVGVWPLRLRDRLPIVPVPLRSPDGDARLDLQALLHRVYDAAGYRHYLYQFQPKPPLSPADAKWASEVIVAASE
jgi:hypothetical protein